MRPDNLTFPELFVAGLRLLQDIVGTDGIAGLAGSGDLAASVASALAIPASGEDAGGLSEAPAKFDLRHHDSQIISDSIPTFVSVLSPKGVPQIINRQIIEYTGRTQEELLGWAASDLIHHADAERAKAEFSVGIGSGEVFVIEYRMRRHDGAYRWFQARHSPVRDIANRLEGWLVTVSDVDDWFSTQEALRASEKRARSLIDGIPGFVAIMTPDGAIEMVNKPILDYTGTTLDGLREWGSNGIVHPDDVPHMGPIFARSIAAGVPYEFEERLRRHDGTYRWFNTRGIPARDETGRIFCWYVLLTDVDERTRAEHALREREREARAMVDSIPAGLGVLDPEGRIESVNAHMISALGRSWEELREWATSDVVHPDDRQRVIDTIAREVERARGFAAEYRIKIADGSYRWFDVRGLPMRDASGDIVRWYVLHIDVDDRHRAEEALKQSEQDLRRTIDALPTAAWSTRPDGYCDFLNEGWLSYAGFSAKEAEGWGWTTALHPDDIAGLADVWTAALASGETAEAEARLRRHDGIYRWFLFRASPLRNDGGEILRWYGTSTDIEDRKRAEETLRASEENLRRTLNALPTTAWASLPDGYCDFLSDRWLEYTGLTAEEAIGWGWTSAVHPEDARAMEVIWREALAEGIPVETEARLRRHDGAYRWFLLRDNPMRDAAGTVVRWYGTGTDIEDLKRAEAALRDSERTYRLMTDTIVGMICQFTPEGVLVGGNQQLLDYFDMPIEEIASWSINGITHPDDLDHCISEFTTSLRSGEPYDFETRFRRHDGVFRWFQIRGRPLRDAGGTILGWYGLLTDIEDRKRIEQELQRSEAFLADAQRVSRTASFAWRVETHVTVWSEEAFRILDFDREAPPSFETLRSRIQSDSVALWDEALAKVRDRPSDFDIDVRLLLSDGRIRHVRIVAHGGETAGGQRELIGVVQDVTERRRAEEALNRARSDLAHVARVSSLGALTASITHEVNQPLSGIVANADTCLRMLTADPPNVAGALETARRTIRDSQRAGEVITRLRALFSNKPPSVDRIDLNEAAQEVIALLAGDLQRAGVSIETALSDDVEPVAGDRVQLQQVIMNLIRNAADAMADIEDRPKHILVSTAEDVEGHVRLEVCDNGTGLHPDTASRLFNAFYSTKPDGMGIGLSVSRSIIDSHLGRLWAANNEAGRGATFSFVVPTFATRLAGDALAGTGGAA